MARFEYSAKLENGKVAKRKSDRIYTHVVAVDGHHPHLLEKWCKSRIVDLERQVADYSAVAEARKPIPSWYHGGSDTAEQTLERHATWAKESAGRLAIERQNLAEGWKTPTVETQGVLTWCGRADLAVKAAASARKEWAGVKILEVAVREITKKAKKTFDEQKAVSK